MLVTISRIDRGRREILQDEVAEEIPLTLRVEGGGSDASLVACGGIWQSSLDSKAGLVTLWCSPSDLEDLVIGFLYTSGVIDSPAEIREISRRRVAGEQQYSYHVEVSVERAGGSGRVFAQSGKELLQGGLGALARPVASNLRVSAELIAKLVEEFQKRSETYLRTGGTHSAALAEKESIVVFREDVGRLNAIDKVIGYLLSQGGSFEDKILITSGRISSEVVLKAGRCGIPIVVSLSAPTSQAVMLARKINLTVVGFARGARMNIYSGEERVA
ncbi:formate dehydrogenase accessory sulfurtransferase FdhD [Thermofilum sp.]|uniref:formate dehydrogenase accessory sulfurtransferase FdhD n=1 Tax=Thermofilum sp. TaxID=1961369 RepID=UPI00316367B8